jgi:hypothetical protein
VGRVQAQGTADLRVQVGGLPYEKVPFVVVEELPVQALLGKPTLATMKAVLEVAAGQAKLVQGGRVAAVRAIALPVRKDSGNPKAQSYWNWLNRRFAVANTRLQAVFQDVCHRADDAMLEKFLASFPDWSLELRRASGMDDPNVHPARRDSSYYRGGSVSNHGQGKVHPAIRGVRRTLEGSRRASRFKRFPATSDVI